MDGLQILSTTTTKDYNYAIIFGMEKVATDIYSFARLREGGFACIGIC